MTFERPPADDLPEAPPIDIPPDIPAQGPPGRKPDWTPGIDEPPMRMPEDNPDVETEL